MTFSKEVLALLTISLLAVLISTYNTVVGSVLLIIVIGYLLVKTQITKQEKRNNTAPVSQYQVADTVMLINQDGIILDCNAQVTPMFGYKQSEVIGQSIEFLMDPSLRNRHVGLRDMFFLTSGQRRMQNRVWALHKNGQRVHIEVHLEISAMNQQTNVICSIRDVERFWKRETELLQENRQIKNSIDLSQGLIHVTQGGHILFANKYVTKLLSYSLDELKTLNIESIIFEDDLSSFNSSKETSIALLEEEKLISLRVKNSKGLSIRAEIKTVYSSEEDILIIHIYDRSADAASSKQLQQSKILLESLLESMPSNQSVWISTLGMNQMIHINPAFSKFWQLELDVLHSDPTQYIKQIDTDDREKVDQIYSGHLRSSWKITYRVTKPDGRIFKVEEKVRLVPDINSSGFLIGIQAFEELQ